VPVIFIGQPSLRVELQEETAAAKRSMISTAPPHLMVLLMVMSFYGKR
jgi:hypothetical protein